MANIKINIPFVKQINDYFCGPASLQMLFNYHNCTKTQEELAEIMGTEKAVGTKKKNMIKAVKRHGFHYCAKENSYIEEIENFLKNKIPVVVNFIEPSDDDSHYAVVIGSDKDEFIFSDPWNGDNFRLLKKEFLKRWYGFEDNRKKWMLAISREPFCRCTCSEQD